jgi:hypothetical protein
VTLTATSWSSHVGWAHNMQLKPTKEPVAQIAYPICPPEPLGGLTWS